MFLPLSSCWLEGLKKKRKKERKNILKSFPLFSFVFHFSVFPLPPFFSPFPFFVSSFLFWSPSPSFLVGSSPFPFLVGRSSFSVWGSPFPLLVGRSPRPSWVPPSPLLGWGTSPLPSSFFGPSLFGVPSPLVVGLSPLPCVCGGGGGGGGSDD